MAILEMILGLLLKCGGDFVIKWLTEKRLIREQKKVEAMETAIKTTKEAEKETEKYKKIIEERDRQMEEVKDTEEQLEAIRKFNEVSKRRKERKKQPNGGGGA